MRQERLDKKKKLLRGASLTFIFAIILVILWIIFFKNRTYLKEYESKYLSFNYDSTWKISKKDTYSASLTHRTDSIINMKVTKIGTYYKSGDLKRIASEVKYEIEKQNAKYKLLKEEDSSTNSKEIYKILYENSDTQSLIVIIKGDNYVCVINCIAKDKYFDMLFDSFNTIINSVKIK